MERKDFKLAYIEANGMFMDAKDIKNFFYPTQEDPYWHIELKNGVVYNVTGEVMLFLNLIYTTFYIYHSFVG